MPYGGTLLSTQPFRLSMSSTFVDNFVVGAVTIFYLGLGGVVDIEYALGREGPVQLGRDVTIPRKASRIVFEVTPATGGAILLTVHQGAIIFEVTFAMDALLVFDVD
jgi:hypothetical protein